MVVSGFMWCFVPLELKNTWVLRGEFSQGLVLPSVSLQVEQVIVEISLHDLLGPLGELEPGHAPTALPSKYPGRLTSRCRATRSSRR